MKKLNILAIETSCDDTSIAVIKNGQIYSNIILSSAELQNTYGGVVPELAARMHEKNAIPALKLALKGLAPHEIDLIAYTNDPGLRVCLNVGESLAYTLHLLLKKPLLPVNHLYAHIFSFHDDATKPIEYPFLGAVISGGHTSIYLVKSVSEIELLNATVDDAVGECYDKIARELKLGYPGGPLIDRMFELEKANLKFMHKMPTVDAPFSFSGLKTAVLNHINKCNMMKQPLDLVSITSSFQKTIIDIVLAKIKFYLNQYPVKGIAIGGGVSANHYLQARLKALSDVAVWMPATNALSADNAAMIGIYANLL